MTPESIMRELKCLEVKENPDGSADLIFEATDKFKELYLQSFGLTEWSQEHFENTIKSAIENFSKHIQNESNNG